MKKILTLLILLATTAMGSHASTPHYWRSDSVKVVRLLEKAATLPPKTNHTLWFARQLCGLPYVAKTLEVNREERLVVNLRQLDCTTYVETVLALALCMKQKAHTFQAFCSNLQRLRYEDGKVAYKDEKGEWVNIPDNNPVSMNVWGFTPDYFEYSDKFFKEFLDAPTTKANKIGRAHV